jgi:hypothetical protein
MWLSEIINQSLCNKFYTKKYIYENPMQQPTYSPTQSANAMRSTISPIQSAHAIQPPPIASHPIQPIPATHPIQPIVHPNNPMIQAANHDSHYDVDSHNNVNAVKDIHIEHADTVTQHLDYVNQNPLAAGSLSTIGDGIMAKNYIKR